MSAPQTICITSAHLDKYEFHILKTYIHTKYMHEFAHKLTNASTEGTGIYFCVLGTDGDVGVI